MPAPDPERELEEMLAELPTREPSQMLDERIVRTLYQSQNEADSERIGHAQAQKHKRTPWLIPMAAAAIVVLGVAVWAVFFNPTPTSPNVNPPLANTPRNHIDRLDLIQAGHDVPVHLQWTRDLGEQTRYTPTGEPYRAILRESVDQRRWYDPETQTIQQFYTPREELVVIKQTTF